MEKERVSSCILQITENPESPLLKRIDIISDLKRKYGNNIEEILRYKAEISDKIDNIKNLEDYIDTLNLKIKEVQISY